MPRTPKPWYWKARDLWCVDIKKTRHNLAKGKANRAEAQAEFHRLMVSLGQKNELGKAYEPTVADVFDAFLENVSLAVERGERAANTYDGYVRYLSSAADRFGSVRAVDLTPHRVHGWADDRDRDWNPTTRANAIAAVKAAFRWARRRGIVPSDPVRDMEKPTPRRRTEILTPEQAAAVMEAADGRFRDLLACLWLTGCRPGELAGLEAAQVDRAGSILHVSDKIRRTTGKATREVHANEAAMAIVGPLCEKHPTGPIFRNRLGNAWTRNAMTCAMRRIRAKTGLGKGAVPYSFRHLYGTDALDRGVDAAFVAELMGHRGTRMLLERYAHLEGRRDSLRAAARRVRPGADEEAKGSGDGVE